jgi:hypothetical protein
LNEAVELVNQASFINGSCGVQEPNITEFRNKEVESSVYDKRLEVLTRQNIIVNY